jgi:dolichol-phosphate mannosyltransferase
MKSSAKSPVAVVVVPTYKEADIIGKTIEYLCSKTFPEIKSNKTLSQNWQMKILVVDGNSPDGTGQVVLDKSKKYPNVYLLTETSKDGIGAAYLKGFKYAIEKLKADYVFEFDSDLQHPPETIPVMLAKMEQGYDYVIGSRKIEGGSNPKGWGFKRLFFSEAGGFVARFLMFFPGKDFWRVTDPTTGLKVTRVKGFVDRLDMDYSHLLTRSFGYKLQLLFQILKMNAKFCEIPLKFQVRTTGESKIEPQTAKEIFLVALRLRLFDPATQKFLKFGLVGGFGFLINFFGLRFFNGIYKNFAWPIGLVNFLANATAAEISIISNFSFNNLWTFAQEKITNLSQLLQKFAAFNLSSIFGGILVPSLIIGLGTQLFGDQYRSLFLIIGVFGFTIPYNWFIYNKFIWKKK